MPNTNVSPLSVYDIAKAKGIEEQNGSVSAGEFAKHDLPFFSGCQICGASLAPYNAYPSNSGFIRCGDCIGSSGFPSVADFDLFEARNARE